jgi:hypothetical protein
VLAGYGTKIATHDAPVPLRSEQQKPCKGKKNYCKRFLIQMFDNQYIIK